MSSLFEKLARNFKAMLYIACAFFWLKAEMKLSCQRRLASSEGLMKQYYVYMMASRRNGTLYVGVTSDLIKRVWEHKSKFVAGFTKKYDVNCLVYYEVHESIEEAIQREKNIKAWKRGWKLILIEKKNPNWDDLYGEATGCQPSLA